MCVSGIITYSYSHYDLFLPDLTLKNDFCWCNIMLGFLFTQNCSQISPHSILCRIIYPFIEYLYIGAYKRTMYQYINVILLLPNLMKNALIVYKNKIRLDFHRSYSLLDLIVTNKVILKLFFYVCMNSFMRSSPSLESMEELHRSTLKMEK